MRIDCARYRRSSVRAKAVRRFGTAGKAERNGRADFFRMHEAATICRPCRFEAKEKVNKQPALWI